MVPRCSLIAVCDTLNTLYLLTYLQFELLVMIFVTVLDIIIVRKLVGSHQSAVGKR